MTDAITPDIVAQRQLDAYNARDLDAILAVYADNAEMYEFPDKLLASGSAALHERFSARFQDGILHATLITRTIMGNTVIDYERVRRHYPNGVGSQDSVVIYDIQHGKIIKTWLIPGVITYEGQTQS
jgi:hypothetical protein